LRDKTIVGMAWLIIKDEMV